MARCSRCGANPISMSSPPGMDYGMVDLGGGISAAGPALDVGADLEAPLPPGRTGARERRAPRGGGARKRPRSDAMQAGAAAAPELPPLLPHSGGKLLDDDPLNDTFGAADAPALELESAERPRPAVAAPSAAAGTEPAQEEREPEPEPTPEELHRRRIAKIAGYGEKPRGLHQAPLYYARVMLRKRQLLERVTALSAQRKRADAAVDECAAKVGEALYGQRARPELAALARQLRAVAQSASSIGAAQAASEERQAARERDFVAREAMLEQAQQRAVPVRQREVAVRTRLDAVSQDLRSAQTARKRLDNELATQRAKQQPDAARIAALEDKRAAYQERERSLTVELYPIQQEHEAVSEKLAQCDAQIAKLDAQVRAVATAVEREQQHARVSAGSARGALRQALVALAYGALEQDLAGAAAPQAEALLEAQERARAARAEEELHRAAMNSYDAPMYLQGARILAGGTLLFFCSFALMIIF